MKKLPQIANGATRCCALLGALLLATVCQSIATAALPPRIKGVFAGIGCAVPLRLRIRAERLATLVMPRIPHSLPC